MTAPNDKHEVERIVAESAEFEAAFDSMTGARPVAQQIVMSDGETYDYTVVSRLIDPAGFPVDDRHTLWESCQGEAMALMYARHRAAEGRWVDVFKNIAHSVTTNKSAALSQRSQP